MTFCILAAIMTLTLFIGVSPGACWSCGPIFYSICEVYGIKPGEHWATMVMVAIPFFGSVTASIFPFKSVPVVGPRRVFPAQAAATVIDFPQYFAWSPHRGLHDRRAYAGLHALRAQAGREQDL